MIIIGSDHAGFQLKEALCKYLQEQKIPFKNVGCYTDEAADYPDFAEKVALEVIKGKDTMGILVCGAGIGMSIAANKVKGIRAALCHDTNAAYLSRGHNDANILVLAGREIPFPKACDIMKKFLETPFEGGRHQKRVDLIKVLEQKYMK